MALEGSEGRKSLSNNATVGAIAGAVVPWLLTKLEGIKVEWSWNWIPDWVVGVGRWLATPVGIKPYVIVWLAVAAYFLLRIVRAVARRMHADTPVDLSFLSYVRERIDGIEWTWEWKKDSGGKYSVTRLRPCCPQCDYPMVWTKSDRLAMAYNALHCEECKHDEVLNYAMSDTENRVRRRVHHTLEQREAEKATAQ